MENIQCIDETLDLNSTNLYHLSIQVSLDGFSFCILNSVNNKFIVLKHFPFDYKINPDIIFEKVERIISKEELLNKKYKSVNAIYKSRKYTIIPSELFEIKNAKLYFENNHILSDLDELHYFKLKSIEATTLFAIPNQIANPIVNKFEDCKIYHHIYPLIEEALKASLQNPDNKFIYLNINNSYFDIISVLGGKLLMHNSFKYVTDNDILYYILFIIKQLNWNVSELNLQVIGNISKNKSIYKLLSSQFDHTKIIQLDKNYIYSYKLNNINTNEFNNLLKLNSCV